MDQDPNKARMDELSKRLAEINRSREAETRQAKGSGSSAGVASGMRIVTELLAGVLGGLLIGWFLDRVLGTSPWFLVSMLFLGTAAAFWNVWKLASGARSGDDASNRDKG